MRKIYCPLMALTLMLSLSACQEDQKKAGPDQLPDSAICLTIGGDSAVTKAGGQSVDLSEESGIDGFTLTEEITSLDDLYFTPATKGTPIFTENLASVYGKVAVTPYSGTTVWGGDRDQEFLPDGNVWSREYPGENFPGEGLLMFVKAPVGNNTGATNIKYYPAADGDIKKGAVSFDYTTPTGETDNAAVAQQDILFSSRHISKSKGDENKILLYHALTGVKFKLGAVGEDGKNLNITSIDKVTFKNLRKAGQCIITPDYTGYVNDSNPVTNGSSAAPKSSTQAVWSFTGDFANVRGDFSQAFSGNEAKGVDFSGTGTYPTIVADAASSDDNVMDSKATKTFMFIPQELVGADVDVIIEYQYKDGDMGPYKGTVTIKDFGEKMAPKDEEGKIVTPASYKWQAGELRTYTITVGDRVEVDIDDKVDSSKKVKSEVTITNTGTAMAYMRVLVVGNWYTNENYVTGSDPVSITPCPELAGLVDNAVKAVTGYSDRWFKDGDYYYYKYPVPGGKTIKPEHTLFSSLDLSSLEVLQYWPSDGTVAGVAYKKGEINPDGHKPYEQCHLEVTLAVQSVRASQVKTAWGETVDGKLVKDNVID